MSISFRKSISHHYNSIECLEIFYRLRIFRLLASIIRLTVLCVGEWIFASLCQSGDWWMFRLFKVNFQVLIIMKIFLGFLCSNSPIYTRPHLNVTHRNDLAKLSKAATNYNHSVIGHTTHTYWTLLQSALKIWALCSMINEPSFPYLAPGTRIHIIRKQTIIMFDCIWLIFVCLCETANLPCAY